MTSENASKFYECYGACDDGGDGAHMVETEALISMMMMMMIDGDYDSVMRGVIVYRLWYSDIDVVGLMAHCSYHGWLHKTLLPWRACA